MVKLWLTGSRARLAGQLDSRTTTNSVKINEFRLGIRKPADAGTRKPPRSPGMPGLRRASVAVRVRLLHESDRRSGGTSLLKASDHSPMDLAHEKNPSLLSRPARAHGRPPGG